MRRVFPTGLSVLICVLLFSGGVRGEEWKVRWEHATGPHLPMAVAADQLGRPYA